MVGKLESAEQQVRDNVICAAQNVSDAVELVTDSLHSVKSTVDESIRSVKRTCDVQRQVRKRPWTMLMGAAAIGFVGAKVTRNQLNGEHQVEPGRRGSVVTYEEPEARKVQDPETREFEETPRPPTRFSKIAESLEPELSMIKGLAIGVAAGIVRDMLVESAPQHVSSSLESIFNSATRRLGGQPISAQGIKKHSGE